MSLLKHETTIRLACFFGTLLIMTIWELFAPKRALTQSKTLRWSSNLGLVLINSIVWRLLVPAGVVGLALSAEGSAWGLFNQIDLPIFLEVIVCVLLLDLAIYAQHIVFHKIPWLWKLHLVHHVDLDIDTTTGIRFHTIETLISFAWKALLILALGTPALAVMIFEILLSVCALFNHSNVRLPLWFDKILRLVLVTPDMHRVHHSVEQHETNSNYGFCLSIWDMIFHTYRAQPDAGHEAMTIGLANFRESSVEKLGHMLALPFKDKKNNS